MKGLNTGYIEGAMLMKRVEGLPAIALRQ